MTPRTPSTVALDIARGAIAGLVATWLMDQVTTGMEAHTSAADKRRAAAAMPDGRTAVENLLVKLERISGITLDDDQRPVALTAIHYGLGVVPAAIYGGLGRVPIVGAGRGLLFGLVAWAVNDELLSSALGLAGTPGEYPLATHLRGLVGHAVLGSTTDTVIAALGG